MDPLKLLELEDPHQEEDEQQKLEIESAVKSDLHKPYSDNKHSKAFKGSQFFDDEDLIMIYDDKANTELWKDDNRRRFRTLFNLYFVGCLVVVGAPFMMFVNPQESAKKLTSTTTTAGAYGMDNIYTASSTLVDRPLAFSDSKELLRAVDSYLEEGDSWSPMSHVALKYGHPIGSWDVSQITDFRGVFSSHRNPRAEWFNDIINNWDVSKATDMTEMFHGASSFNEDLSNWNVSHVTSMNMMFRQATSFEGMGLAEWDVSHVTDMGMMFDEASEFEGDVSKWDVSHVKNMGAMFRRAKVFNSDIRNWDTGNVHSMGKLFYGASSFNRDISNWDMWKVSNMIGMFYGATSFDQNLCMWGMGLLDMKSSFKVTEMFEETNCPSRESPSMHKGSQPGPFCYQCN